MLKRGFVTFEHSATAIAVVHFGSSKPCLGHYSSVEIRVLASEGDLKRVILVISAGAQLPVRAICLVPIETCRKVPKSAEMWSKWVFPCV